MAKRRSWRPAWHAYRDASTRDGMPFTFMQVEHLVALGVAVGTGPNGPALERDLLAVWAPPADATDAYVLTVDAASPHIVRTNPAGMRIDEIAAQALWSLRAELERDGLVTRHGWCTHCGRHFIDERNGHHVQVARWCPAHRNVRVRHLPQRRLCAAGDCDRWFRPSRANQVHCTDACKRADSRTLGSSSLAVSKEQ